MNLELNQNCISDIFTESGQKDSAEARNNLLGLFEVLVGIDRRLKAEGLAKSINRSNNKS